MSDLIPAPRPDPRTMQSMIEALMAQSHPQQGVPLPRPDPRDWATRAINPQVQPEENLQGAIHPDAMLQMHGYDPRGGIDTNTYMQPQIDQIMRNSTQGPQRPFSMPGPKHQQDVGNGIFGVPHQHLMQMAGDVVPLPVPSAPGGLTDLLTKQGANEEAARKGGVGYDPKNVDFGLLDKLNK